MGNLLNAKFTVDTKSLNRILTNLKKTQTKDFLENLNLDEEARKALSFLKRHFPRSNSDSRSPGSKDELARFGVQTHLADYWHLDTELIGNAVGFIIYHALGDVDRVRTVLNSLNAGTRAYIWQAPDTMRFQIKEDRWIGYAKNEQIPMSPRTGFHYVEDTVRYIEDVLMAKVRRKVDTAIQEQMR